MPKLQISQSHNLTAAEAHARIDTLSKDLGDKYGLTSKWISDTEAKVERTGAKGTITILANLVNVELDLSFAMTPLKGTIEKRIKEELERLFRAA
jgi:putative polyhydroxyalkanoate system protein